MESLTAAFALLSLGFLVLALVMRKRSVVVSMMGLIITILALTRAVKDSTLGDDMMFFVFPLFAVLLFDLAMIAWPEKAGW